MKEKYWVLLVLFAFVASGVGFGWAGYDIGWDEGYHTRDMETLRYVPPPEITWSRAWSETDEPEWESTLYEVLEQIDTANITIHLEDIEGVRADIHISWSK